MSLLNSMCFLMSLILSFLSCFTNVTRQLYVDIRKDDGRYVLWKEDEYLFSEGELVISSDSRQISSVLVSYDDGKSYILFPGNTDKEELILNPEDFRDPVCFRFLADGRFISRKFRINFI